MKRALNNQSGFGVIQMALILLAVLGILGLVGWHVCLRYYRAHGVQPSESMHSSDLVTYCSAEGGICFKYPSDWQKTETSGSNPASTMITIASPSKTVKVVYSPVIMGVGGHCNPNTCFFTAGSIVPLSSTQAAGLSVVKGVYTNHGTGATLANYFLGSNDKLAPYSLKVNQRVDVGTFGTLFTSPLDSAALEELRIRSVPDNGFASEAEANAWLAKPEVITAGNVLLSVYVSKTNH